MRATRYVSGFYRREPARCPCLVWARNRNRPTRAEGLRVAAVHERCCALPSPGHRLGPGVHEPGLGSSSPSWAKERCLSGGILLLGIEPPDRVVAGPDGGVGLNKPPFVAFAVEDRAPSWRTERPSGKVIVRRVLAQPTVPSSNASVPSGENRACPPASITSPRRKSATAAPPRNHSSGSLPIRQLPGSNDTKASTTDASPRVAAMNHRATRSSSSGERRMIDTSHNPRKAHDDHASIRGQEPPARPTMSASLWAGVTRPHSKGTRMAVCSRRDPHVRLWNVVVPLG